MCFERREKARLWSDRSVYAALDYSNNRSKKSAHIYVDKPVWGCVCRFEASALIKILTTQHTHCMPTPLGSVFSLINSWGRTENSQLSYKSICQWLSQSFSVVFYKLTEWDVCPGDAIFLKIKVLSVAPCSRLFKPASRLQLQIKLLWQISGEWRRHSPVCAPVNIADGNIAGHHQKKRKKAQQSKRKRQNVKFDAAALKPKTRRRHKKEKTQFSWKCHQSPSQVCSLHKYVWTSCVFVCTVQTTQRTASLRHNCT